MGAKLQVVPKQVVFWLHWGTLWFAVAAVALSPLWLASERFCVITARISAFCFVGSVGTRLLNRPVRIESDSTHLSVGSARIPVDDLRDVELTEIRKGHRVVVRQKRAVLPTVLEVDGGLEWLSLFRGLRIRHFGRRSMAILVVAVLFAMLGLVVVVDWLGHLRDPRWLAGFMPGVLLVCGEFMGAHDFVVFSSDAPPKRLCFSRAGLFDVLSVTSEDGEQLTFILGLRDQAALRRRRELALLLARMPTPVVEVID